MSETDDFWDSKFSEDDYPIRHCDYDEIIDMVNFARHIHVKQDEKNDDSCKYCGMDWRHTIHIRQSIQPHRD